MKTGFHKRTWSNLERHRDKLLPVEDEVDSQGFLEDEVPPKKTRVQTSRAATSRPISGTPTTAALPTKEE